MITNCSEGAILGNDLWSRYGRNVDLCIIAALRRYCLVVPMRNPKLASE